MRITFMNLKWNLQFRFACAFINIWRYVDKNQTAPAWSTDLRLTKAESLRRREAIWVWMFPCQGRNGAV